MEIREAKSESEAVLVPLPSWNDGAAKAEIIQFVENVTIEGGPTYIRPEKRIATFDNDGTLMCEQPMVQFIYIMYRIKQLAPDHSEWRGNKPFEAALKGDMDYLLKAFFKGGKEIFQLLNVSHAGISLADFNRSVKDFFKSERHPKYGVAYTDMVYQPMLELLEYLRSKGFKTYICSGGGIDFMRVFAKETYGVVPENIIGSSGRNTFKEVNGQWQLMKSSDQFFKDDKEGKPVGIDRHVGRIPIFAAGNVRNAGDIAMLTYCHMNPLPSFQLLINHDDEQREYAYSEKDNASLNAAKEGQWHVVSMKMDWKRIFPFN